jgi:hypothetical protein
MLALVGLWFVGAVDAHPRLLNWSSADCGVPVEGLYCPMSFPLPQGSDEERRSSMRIHSLDFGCDLAGVLMRRFRVAGLWQVLTRVETLEKLY